MATLDEEREMWLETICTLVAEGETLKEIGKRLGVTSGHLIKIVSSSPEAEKHYARARDSASDLLEAEILEAARNVDKETAQADRVRIDALKWIAARRAPKRYGDRVQQDHTSSDGSMTPKPSVDLSKLSDAALKELMSARSTD